MRPMTSFPLLLMLGVWLACSESAQAQRRNTVGTTGPSVTVQLPTFHYFGTSTTVLVPDRGYVTNGGISRSSSGQVTQGLPLFPFSNRGFGRSVGGGSVSTGVWIHDLQAMDENLLLEAKRRRGELPNGTNQNLSGVSGAAEPAEPILVSADEYRKRQAEAQSELQGEAARHFAKGQAVLAEGKSGVARIYFQMALRRAEEPLKSQVAAALAELSGTNVARD